LATDDFSEHDDQDRRRLAELRRARTAGDGERVRALLGELIAGWRPIGEGWLVARAGRDVADDVIARLEARLVELVLLRKQRYDQPWGTVYWSNLKWILADVRREQGKQAAREAVLDERLGDPTADEEREALDDRLSVDAARLHRALAKISGTDRELLELIFWDDLGPAELAERLGVAKGTIAVRKHRAMERLTEAFFSPDVIDPPES
jgi:RNA polymerase sigma factor (sigma-70 family)